ncbi:TPA: hypothetical protein ACX6RT_003489 [Photobacterium damselae]
MELIKSSNVIVGIKEAMFVRFYEQSLLGATMGFNTVAVTNIKGVNKESEKIG